MEWMLGLCLMVVEMHARIWQKQKSVVVQHAGLVVVTVVVYGEAVGQRHHMR